MLFKLRIDHQEELNGIPNSYVRGLVSLESGYDPGAIGVNGFDSGLCQINLDPVNGHGQEFTIEQAFDPAVCIGYTADRMGVAFETYAEVLESLAWKLAVGQHNSPLNAKRWRDAALAVPPSPTEQDSLDRILSVSTYVNLVDSKY